MFYQGSSAGQTKNSGEDEEEEKRRSPRLLIEEVVGFEQNPFERSVTTRGVEQSRTQLKEQWDRNKQQPTQQEFEEGPENSTDTGLENPQRPNVEVFIVESEEIQKLLCDLKEVYGRIQRRLLHASAKHKFQYRKFEAKAIELSNKILKLKNEDALFDSAYAGLVSAVNNLDQSEKKFFDQCWAVKKVKKIENKEAEAQKDSPKDEKEGEKPLSPSEIFTLRAKYIAKTDPIKSIGPTHHTLIQNLTRTHQKIILSLSTKEAVVVRSFLGEVYVIIDVIEKMKQTLLTGLYDANGSIMRRIDELSHLVDLETNYMMKRGISDYSPGEKALLAKEVKRISVDR